MNASNLSLDQLIPDPLNARTYEQTGILELAVSIKEHGLLQPLVVRQADPDAATWFVTAGGRRLAAIKMLAEMGDLEPTCSVAVNVLSEAVSSARELSLVENIMRQAMHPADLYQAFARLKLDGLSAKKI